MVDKKKRETLGQICEDIGLVSDPEEQEQNGTNSTAPTKQGSAPLGASDTHGRTNTLQVVGTETGNNKSTLRQNSSAQSGAMGMQQTTHPQENAVQPENYSPEDAKIEQQGSNLDKKTVTQHADTKQESAEKNAGSSEDQSKFPTSNDPSRGKQQPDEKQTGGSSRMTQPPTGKDNRLDKDKAWFSRAVQKDEELRTAPGGKKEAYETSREECSGTDGASARHHQMDPEPNPEPELHEEAASSPRSIHLQTSGQAETGFSSVITNELHSAATEEERSELQKRNLSASPANIQGRVEDLREHLNRSIRGVSSAHETPLPSSPSRDDEQNRHRTSVDVIDGSETKPAEQDPAQIYMRATEIPPKMNNETDREVPTSPLEGVDDQRVSEDVERIIAEDRPTRSSPPPLPLRNPASTLTVITQTSETSRHCAVETPDDIVPLVNPQSSIHVENIQAPPVPIDSSSLGLTINVSDDKDKRGKGNSESIRGGCKPQDHQRKDDDEDDGTDQTDSGTPTVSHGAVGKSRKLSPSASADQPRKRRSFSGAEREEQEIGEDQQVGFHLETKLTAIKSSSRLKVTDETKLLELTPSKSPDRPREYIFPPGMPPVSRLEVPENFPLEPPLLGSGRRYQRINMPSEYIPPRLGDIYSSSESRNSGEGGSFTDGSEIGDEEEERANGEALHEKKREESKKLHHTSSLATEMRISSHQKRSLRRSPTPIPPRRNPQVLRIRSKDVLPRVKKDGFESPEIEAWTESPKLPPPRDYGNQEVIRAKNMLIYRAVSTTPSHRISARGRLADMLRGENLIDIMHGGGSASGIERSRANWIPRRETNPHGHSNPIESLNVGQSAGESEIVNRGRNRVAAQTSLSRHEMLRLSWLLSARNEAQN